MGSGFTKDDGHTEYMLIYRAYTQKLVTTALSEKADWRTFCEIGFHYHLLLELLLKACLLHQDNEYPKSHNLTDLAKNIKFLELTSNDYAHLACIQPLHMLRYPFPLPTKDNTPKAFAEFLKKCLDDFSTAEAFIVKISSQMPAGLNKIYNEIFSDDPLSFE